MIKWLEYFYSWYWWGLLEKPLRWVEQISGLPPQEGWSNFAWKAGFTAIIFFITVEIWMRIRYAIHMRGIRKSMAGHEVKEVTLKDPEFVEELDAAQFPVQTFEQLKKEKRYGRMAEIYAKLNQPVDAAKWFEKDRQTQRAAEEWAKAGKTARAAKLLWKSGDYATSARFYLELGKPKLAAGGFEHAGLWAEAARAHAEAGNMKRALECFTGYFREPNESPEAQDRMADLCYQFLEDPAYAGKLDPALRASLMVQTAERFLRQGRNALAAQIFAEAGAYQRAADVFARLGNNAKAQQCLDLARRSGSV